MFSLISLVLRLRAERHQPAAIVAPIMAANDTHAVERLSRAA
jgi:hypothetical protein